VELVEVPGQVAVAGADSLAPGSREVFPLGLGGQLGGDAGGVACEDRGQVVGCPGFGLGGARFVEGVGGGPHVLDDVHEVQQDVDGDAAAASLRCDQVELVAGAVDQDDPRAQAFRIAGLGLVEGVGDDLFGRADQGGSAPLVLRLRSRAGGSFAAAAAGRVDHVVRASGSGAGVEDAGHGGHPLPVQLLARRESAAMAGRGFHGGPAGGLAQCLRAHDHALAVHLDHQRLHGTGITVR
jgi:hypothetical protein